MKLFRSALLAAALAAFSPAMAQSQQNSGNAMLNDCKLLAEGKQSQDVFFQGICAGIVETLFIFADYLPPEIRFCRPNGSTVSQGVKVAVKFIENNPAKMQMSVQVLAALAFAEAWPCPK